MNTTRTLCTLAAAMTLAAGANAQVATGPTHAYIMEGSGFFGAPGVGLGSIALVDLNDPSNVTLLAGAGDDFRFGGVDVRPGTGAPYAFENSTNSLRIPDTTNGGNTLVDSVGWHESGTAGLTFSNDGTIAYTTTAVGGFGRVVESDADTGETLGVHNIIGITLSSLATVPEGHPDYPAGEIWGLGLTALGSVYLYRLDLETNTVVSSEGVTGIGFNPQFETGLDWAPDGTLYALIQGYRQLGPDTFEEISSHLYTIDPATGHATEIGVVQADATWDAVGLALVEDAAPCPADLTGDGNLNNSDINAFVNAFLAEDPAADFNHDGNWNNTDINAFVNAFIGGCS